jgi:hypothetical protein
MIKMNYHNFINTVFCKFQHGSDIDLIIATLAPNQHDEAPFIAVQTPDIGIFLRMLLDADSEVGWKK